MVFESILDKIPIIRDVLMEQKHKDVLQKIVELEGNCLEANLCKDCPFKLKCLPQFLKDPKARPTREERYHMALHEITDNFLFKEENNEENF